MSRALRFLFGAAVIGVLSACASGGGAQLTACSFTPAAQRSTAAGEWVAVSGLRNADTVIEGTSVVRLPQAGARVMVAGPVRANAATGFQIANLAIGSQAVAPGDAVVVAGRLSNGAIVVDHVRPQLEARFTASVRHLSLQTLSPSDTLMGLRIAAAAIRPMTPGAPIQMEGSLTAGNTFVPGRITIPELPRDGQVAVRGFIIDRGVVLRGINPGDNVGTALVPRPGVRPPERPDIIVPETPPVSPN